MRVGSDDPADIASAGEKVECRRVPRSRAARAYLVLLPLVFMALAGTLMMRDLPVYTGAIILACLAAIALALRHSFDQTAVLAYGPQGLWLFPKHPELPPIPWDAIHDIPVGRLWYWPAGLPIPATRIAAVIVDEPDRYMPPAGGLGRLRRALNKRSFGSPLVVSEREIRGDLDTLMTDWNRYALAGIPIADAPPERP